jgi:hypothetical protein
MYCRLMENLYINKILVEEQFEFTKNLATQVAILELTNGILRSFSNQSMVVYVVTLKRLLILSVMRYCCLS